MNVVDRARADIDEGRLWKAKDRLTGALLSNPTDQELLNLLGAVYYAMHDLEAGKYWYLTERTGPEVEAALQALHGRYGAGTRGLAQALPVRARVGDFPQPVAERLQPILEQHKFLRHWWRPRNKGRPRDEPVLDESLWSRFTEGVVVFATLLLTVGVWLFGVISILMVVFR